MSHFIVDSYFVDTHFWLMSLSSFFLHHGINQIILPPRKSTFDSQMLRPRQSWQRFSRCSLAGATLENKTTLPVFLYVPPLRYKPRIKQQKYMQTTMVNAGSSNSHSKYEPKTVVRTFLTLHHPLAPSRQGALTLRSLGNHFVPKNHPFPPELVKSVNLRKHTLGEKKQGHFSLPTLVSRVLHHHWR